MPEDMIKYSILMPYYERLSQLEWTLLSFLHHYGNRTDYEVIIIEDAKNVGSLKEIASRFDHLRVAHSCIKDIYNPAPLFNLGADIARGDFLVLTSPEVMHWTNVLSIFDEELDKNPNGYVIAACESATNCRGNPDDLSNFQYDHHMWYQHSEHRNLEYHFCSVIGADQYAIIGGFDERYANGVGYDDDDFIDRVRHADISIVTRDDAWTIHQEHKRTHQLIPRRQYMKLLERNRGLFKTRELQ